MERYIHYYNHERIKQKLASMRPTNYRTHAS
ncbi:IS3 family transposase [Planococcus shixiaomingii]